MKHQPNKTAKAKSASVSTNVPYRRQNQRQSARNIHRSTARSKPKSLTQKKRYPPDPWNDLDKPLELFVSPEIKQRLGLTCRTTVEYLEELQK